MASNQKRSDAAKRFWEKIRRVAEEQGISVQQARALLATRKQASKSSTQETSMPRTSPPKKAAEVDLVAAEKKLKQKYPHLIEGTLQLPEQGEKKRSVEIACEYPGCQTRRRVFTSDLFQVHYCVEHSKSRNKKATQTKEGES